MPLLGELILAIALNENVLSWRFEFLQETIFWAAMSQWAVLFPAAIELVRRLPVIFNGLLQLIAELVISLVLYGLAFATPLWLTGNIPIPCCEQSLAYKWGSGFGLAIGFGVLWMRRAFKN